MDEEVRVGFQTNYFAPPNRTPLTQEEEEENRVSRKIEIIAHYILVFVLLSIIGFYVFFISTILVDKYLTNSKFFHYEYPYSHEVDKNRALYKAEYLTICNLDDTPFEFFYIKKISNNNTSKFKSVTIEPSNEFHINCVTAVKFKGKSLIEIFDKFKCDKLNDGDIKVIKSLKNEEYKEFIKSKDVSIKKDNDKNNKKQMKRSFVSIFSHRYRQIIDKKRIMQHSLVIDHKQASKIILKNFNDETFKMVVKEKKDSNLEHDVLKAGYLNMEYLAKKNLKNDNSNGSGNSKNNKKPWLNKLFI
ncbi:hypothetical protein RB653_004798 [Dictyostelium firmibasis]|uniref:Transmembrane protein n=1 Tax=Dictyostelium firmibasis TaxID=79012 RepID=A0AAN7Z0F7_9MYCE